MKAKAIVIGLALILSFATFVTATGKEAFNVQVAAADQAICFLPTGGPGIRYEGEGKPESPILGPTALAIGPDGSYWIGDPVQNRLWHIGADCKLLASVDLSGRAVGIADLEVTSSGMWVLDIAALPPSVIHLSPAGEERGRYDIPEQLRAGLSGIMAGEDGELLVEGENGALLHQLVDPAGVLAPSRLEAYQFAGHSVVAQPGGLPAGDAARAHVILDGRQIDVPDLASPAGLWFLGSAPDGTFYVVAEEVTLGQAIEVDQTVRQYSSDGVLLGAARVPLAESYSYVPHGLALGPQGPVLALVTLPHRIEIRRLAFSPSLPRIPSAKALAGASLPARESGPEACISREQIAANANEYLNNSKYLSDANISGTCAGRTKPRYLGSPGTYPSVSYDWGGWDTVSAFNSFMDPNTYQAGDINTASVESCSKGVDCSGFVTRVWGRSDKKYSTSTLPTISWQLPDVTALLQGDIVDKSGSHVILFGQFASGGIYGWESTTSNNVDRVVWQFRSWSALSGYLPYRYNGLCLSCDGQYTAEYYNNMTLSGSPAFTLCESKPINHNWGKGGPGNGVGNDNFSVRWHGTFDFQAGNYTLVALTSDGMRVWLDGSLVLDKWFDQEPTGYRVSMWVDSGPHEIKVEYYERKRTAVAQLSW